MKKKIGDLTLNEIKAILSHCDDYNDCSKCIFRNIRCGFGYIDEMELGDLDLDQEIDIEDE